MIRRLRAKFIWTNMIIVTVTLSVILCMVFQFTRKDLREQNLKMMEEAAENAMKPELPGLRRPGLSTPYFVVEIRNHGVIQVNGSEQFNLTDADQLEQLVELALSGSDDTGELPEYSLRYYRAVTPFGSTIVYSDISGESETLQSLLRVCLMIGILAFALFLGISILLARWAVRPVERAWQQQRQFVADASHELKTPLTVIMTNAELLQNEQFAETDQTRFKESILTVSRQMRGLVESLLELARVDNGAVQSSFARLDLSALAEEAVLPFEAIFFERELDLCCDVQEGIFVRGSGQHLRQVIEILLDNAGKYAVGGREVCLALRKSGRNHCQLCVSNHAEELDEIQLKDIFKRFYRADEVRSMSGSYGLGLSIAESIVQDHHGKIWAEYADGVIRFHVQLPTA